ncbi:hypothetical protein [Corticicoccus populi]|uniref:Uncharacterized protein n=1 Tax=Corticicoccus populi TaxID=1812821 RepID=A0ABW5WZE7_9STAP
MLLKEELKNLRENDYKLSEDINIEHLIKQMQENIGDIDSELRDDLIYSTFGYLISNDFLSKEMLKHILETCPILSAYPKHLKFLKLLYNNGKNGH